MDRFLLIFLPAAVLCALFIMALRRIAHPRPASPAPDPAPMSASETMSLLDDLEDLLPSGAGERRAGLARIAARVAGVAPEPMRSGFFMDYLERSENYREDLVGALTITKNILDSLARPQSPAESAERYSELFQIYDYLDQMTWKRLLMLLEVLGFVKREGQGSDELLSRTALGGELLSRINDHLDLGSIDADNGDER